MGRMKRLKNLLRNRKQSDRVKIMLYLGIAAVIFLVLTAFDIADLVKYINTPAEYILSCDAVSDAGLDQLLAVDGVSAVTPEISRSLTIKYRANKTVTEAACISKEYAKAVYGIEHKGEMTTVYANSKAYQRILSALAGVNGDPDMSNEIKAEVLEGDRYKACRIVKIDQEISAEEPFAFIVAADSVLKKQAHTVRVFVPRQDTEQIAVGRIQDMGYWVTNREAILSFHNRIDHLFLEIKYHLIIAVMCGLWIATLRRFASDTQR